mgnify:CR=1 FL=1
MKIKKIFLSMLLMIVAICFCPTKVFATSTIERTTTLDVSKFIQDEENKEEGWSWNSTTNTLTLTNVNFNTGDNKSIVLEIYILYQMEITSLYLAKQSFMAKRMVRDLLYLVAMDY